MSRSHRFAQRTLPWLCLFLFQTVQADNTAPLPDSGGVAADFAEQMLNNRDRHSYTQLQELTLALDKASRENPDNQRLTLLAARAQLAVFGGRGQFRASQLLDQVLQKSPNQPLALVLRAAGESMNNCSPCVRATLEQARRSAPQDPEVLEALGHYNLREGWRMRSAANARQPADKLAEYYRQAQDHFQRALAVQPDQARRASLLANIFDIQNYRGQFGQADLTLRKAIQLLPDHPGLRERYANFLIYRKGDWANGALQAREALVLRGSDQARSAEALALYMLWAQSYQASRQQPAQQAETERRLEAARKAWPDTDELFLYATSAEHTAPIAEAMLQAGLYTSAKGDYRDKDGDTPLGNAILNYGRSLMAGEDEEARLPPGLPAMTRLIERLLADGANVNAFTSQGDSLLGAAVRSGDLQLVRKLLAAGANPHLPGRLGLTPLMAAASLQDGGKGMAMAELLLARGVDIAAYDRPKRSALHYAAGSGNTDLVALLLKKGSRPEERDEDGNTPLDWAAAAGQDKVATLLLAAGAEVNKHETACGSSDSADYATSAGHEELARLLRSRRKSSL